MLLGLRVDQSVAICDGRDVSRLDKNYFSPSKLDPAGPAYQKMKNSKKFDPAPSSVLLVRAGEGGKYFQEKYFR